MHLMTYTSSHLVLRLGSEKKKKKKEGEKKMCYPMLSDRTRPPRTGNVAQVPLFSPLTVYIAPTGT